MVISLFGMFIPYVYIIIPAHESQVCLCDFFLDQYEGILQNLKYIGRVNTFRTLQVLSMTMFFMVNWLFLVALIYMGFKIRWIRDNLSLNTEL